MMKNEQHQIMMANRLSDEAMKNVSGGYEAHEWVQYYWNGEILEGSILSIQDDYCWIYTGVPYGRRKVPLKDVVQGINAGW